MEIRQISKSKKGMAIGDAPMLIMIIGFVFLLMVTIAYVSEKFGDNLTENSTAYNLTQDLQTELSDNSSMAGMLLTISFIGIILGVLISVFALGGKRRM